MATQPRRSPAPADRQRDADRSRRALLDAALTEFAAKGFDGARVNEIAERAGVNKQLVSYYFDGKQGLYDTILSTWFELEEQIAEPGISLAELVSRYLEAGHSHPELMRLWVRQSLNQETGPLEYEPDAPEVVELRARQVAGEVTDELDPAFLQLALQAVVASGVTQPGDAKRYLGLDPGTPEYLEFMDAQIRRLIHLLGGPSGGNDDGS